ncbi:hypothetical protein ACFB49_48780 [Sphingomonas sp. DBB INV C78]|uniref:hypothetical protein n=1 Tax=Sphingomonas sp. DBB INV C78 TaxID=3349434 RepID=UPI0036D40513
MQRDFRHDGARRSTPAITAWLTGLADSYTHAFEPLQRIYFDAPWKNERRGPCSGRY